MSVLDNFLANQDKVRYTSYFNADKIATYSTKAYSSGIGSHGSLGVGTGSPASPQVYYAGIPNPYGRKCLPTMSWSIDDINYYPPNSPIFYYNATYMTYAWQCLGFMGCSDSFIYIGATTQYDVAPQKMYVQFAMDSPT